MRATFVIKNQFGKRKKVQRKEEDIVYDIN